MLVPVASFLRPNGISTKHNGSDPAPRPAVPPAGPVASVILSRLRVVVDLELRGELAPLSLLLPEHCLNTPYKLRRILLGRAWYRRAGLRHRTRGGMDSTYGVTVDLRLLLEGVQAAVAGQGGGRRGQDGGHERPSQDRAGMGTGQYGGRRGKAQQDRRQRKCLGGGPVEHGPPTRIEADLVFDPALLVEVNELIRALTHVTPSASAMSSTCRRSRSSRPSPA